jgi:hypothetical protein
MVRKYWILIIISVLFCMTIESVLANGTSVRQSIITIARQQLGKPYVLGAAGPDSFDCSGLVNFSYNNSGISALQPDPHGPTAASLYNNYCDILSSEESLLPGDLVFYEDLTHVGIYTENDTVIDAEYYYSGGQLMALVAEHSWGWDSGWTKFGRVSSGNWPNNDNSWGNNPPIAHVGELSNHTYDQAIINAYNRNNGQSACGNPFDNGGGLYVHQWGPSNNGWLQDFRGGSYGWGAITRKDGVGTAYCIHGTIWDKWLALNGPWGDGGWPVSDEQAGNVSAVTGIVPRYVRLERGTINYHPSGAYAGKAFGVCGGIFDKYCAMGYSSSTLGIPISDEFDAARSPGGTTGRLNRFEGGSIYWCASYGPHPVYGSIGAQYESQGGTGGSLGFPTSDPYSYQGTTRQDFQGGFLLATAATSLKITGTTVSGSSVTLTWTPGTGDTYFKVWRDGVKLTATPLSGSTRSYTDTNAPAGEHVYTVWGNNGTRDTTSDSRTVTVGVAVGLNITDAAVSGSSVTLTWTPGTGDTCFKVWRDGVKLTATPLSGSTRSYTDKNVPTGQHLYTVWGNNGTRDTTSDSQTVTVGVVVGLSITDATVSGSSVTLTWTPGIGDTYFKVWRDGVKITPTPLSGSTRSYTDTNVPDGQHLYTVWGNNGTRDTTSDSLAVTVGAVVNLDITDATVDGSSVTLTWTPGTGDTYFKVWRDGVKITPTPLSGSTRSYTDNNVPDGLHTYVVWGNNGTQDTTSDNCTVTVGTLTALEITDATVDGSSVTLTWTPGNSDTYFKIWRDGVKITPTPLSGSTRSYTDTNVPDGQHLYTVWGNNGTRDTTSDSRTITVGTVTALEIIDATVNGSSVTLTWTPGTGDTCFKVWRDGVKITPTPLSGSTRSYTDTNVSDGLHTYVVWGNNGTRDTTSDDYTITVGTATTLEITDVTVSGSSVTLIWTPGTGDTCFKIWRDGVKLTATPLSGSARSYTDTSVPAGQHTYTVWGNNGTNDTTSDDYTVTIGTVTVLAITDARVDGSSVTLTWTPGTGDTCFKVWRDGVKLTTTPLSGSTRSYTDTSVPGGWHTYTVWGNNGSSDTTSDSATLSIGDVVGLIITDATVNGSSVTLTWTPGTGDTCFKVWRDGVKITPTPLSGSTRSYTDTNVPDGQHNYVVWGNNGTQDTTSDDCTVTVSLNVEAVADLQSAGIYQFSLPVSDLGHFGKQFTLRDCISDPDVVVDRNDATTGKNYQVWTWSAPAQAFVYGTLDDLLNPGQAYFVEISEPCTLTADGIDLSFNREVCLGWNLIGAPAESADITAILGKVRATSGPWIWDDTIPGYSLSSSLDPFGGYWLQVSMAGTLGFSQTTGSLTQNNMLPPTSPILTGFSDVLPANWAYDAINEMLWLGITGGSSNDAKPNKLGKVSKKMTFSTTGTVTRAQMAMFLVRAFNLDLPECPVALFGDVKTTDWANRYVEAVYQAGIMGSYAITKKGVTFSPKTKVTRAQFAIMLARAAGLSLPNPVTQVYTDVPTTLPGAAEIEALEALGIFDGQPGLTTQFRPTAYLTRAEMALYFHNLLNLTF